MKIFFIIISLFSINFVTFSQNKRIIVIDSITKKPIEYANIKYLNSEKGTFSDSLGFFILNKKSPDKLLISVLGFENKITLTEKILDTILLKPKTIILDEILININSKQSFGFHLKKGEFLGSSVKRAVIAVYIKNNNELESVISNLHFSIRKKSNSLSVVRPHLYSINKETNKPDIEILDNNILIKEKERRKGVLTINIIDQNIVFPKEGVFLALEWVGNTEDIDFGYHTSDEKSENTFLTSLDFKNSMWIPVNLPKNNKSINANFGISTIVVEK